MKLRSEHRALRDDSDTNATAFVLTVSNPA